MATGTPRFIPSGKAQLAEEFNLLLAQLASDELRAVAVWKLEGHTNAEIASRLGCAEVTVERRLRLIRTLLNTEASD